MAIAGKKGKICLAEDKVLGIKNWSLELSIDSLETTALGDEWKNFIPGLKEWSASSEGDYAVIEATSKQEELQTAFLNGTDVVIKLYVDESNYYTGTAIITSLSIEDPVDDVISISIEFTGNGALTFEKSSGA